MLRSDSATVAGGARRSALFPCSGSTHCVAIARGGVWQFLILKKVEVALSAADAPALTAHLKNEALKVKKENQMPTTPANNTDSTPMKKARAPAALVSPLQSHAAFRPLRLPSILRSRHRHPRGLASN